MKTRGSALLVALGARSYEIHVEPGALARAGRVIEAAAGGRGFVITDGRVEVLHGAALRAGLGRFRAETIIVPAGERQKSLRRAGMLWEELLRRGADRESVVVAFGGGVVGDLAGFVAATYMRGLPFVQIPTTLLAQVDSSVGGKVAINHPRAKNLIGAFHQPRAVIADVSVLQTLRRRDYREGIAEAVKTAVIADPAFYGWLEANQRAVASRDPSALCHLVSRCCELKARVVESDERESGRRALLNFGHTVGHALESLTGYGRLRHGEAVSVGMVAAARLSRLLGLLSSEDERRLVSLLAEFGLPTTIPGIGASAILEQIKLDKKARAGVPELVVLKAIGKARWGVQVGPRVLRAALRRAGATG
ncbi:MAG: 3-dehydroquinate synthase [Armatimonadota bacterium]